MIDSDSDSNSISDKVSNTPNLSPKPSSSSCSSKNPYHYDIVFSPLQESTTLTLPEVEPTKTLNFGTGDPHLPAKRLPNLDFIPTDEGSLLGSIHTRIAALRSSATDSQVRYSQAISPSIPMGSTGSQNVRMAIENSLWNSTTFFTEGEVAPQLLQYRERFAFLSQRHAEELASSSLSKAQDLVYRSQVAIAAIRIVSEHKKGIYNRSVGHGHHARHSSEVSIWGWKPWREMALAEKVSERKRERAAQEREKMREKYIGRSRFLVLFGDGMDQKSKPEQENGISLENRSIESHAEGGRRSCLNWDRQKVEGTEKRRDCFDGVSDPRGSCQDSENHAKITSQNLKKSLLGYGASLTDGATELEMVPTIPDDPQGPTDWPQRSKSEVQWRLPVYYEVKKSTLTIPQVGSVRAGSVVPTTATVTQIGDSFLRVHTISEPSGMGYVSSSSSGLRISPQISPKSTSPNVSSGKDTYGSSVPDMSDIEDITFRQFPIETPSTPISLQSSLSFDRVLPKYRKKQPGGSDSNSDSTVGASRARNKLRKVKAVFKSLPLTRIHFPWPSSSDEESRVGRGGQTSASTDSSSFADPSSSEQSWPPPSSISPGHSLIQPPPPKEYYSYIGDHTPETRIHSPHPKTINSPPHPGKKFLRIDATIMSQQPQTALHRGGDPLTRTEKEYQEVLAMLTELKSDLRAKKRGVWRRNRSRGETEREKRGSTGRSQR